MAENENKAGVIALICSFLFPIVGVILYFVKKEKVENAKAYLYSALGGFGVGIIIRVIAMIATNSQ